MNLDEHGQIGKIKNQPHRQTRQDGRDKFATQIEAIANDHSHLLDGTSKLGDLKQYQDEDDHKEIVRVIILHSQW